jgi:hypothetical protein
MAPQVEKRKTLAAPTTTSLGAAPRPGPSPQQIQAEQKKFAELDRQRKAAAQAPQQPQLPVPAAAAVPPAPVSAEAVERHLAAWGGGTPRRIAFNGSSGIFRTLDDDVEVPSGTQFIGGLSYTRRGFVKFNGDGEPPTLVMVSLGEDADLPRRETLGDNDPQQWPISTLTGQAADPWQEQICIPLISRGADGEVYECIARGVVALRSAGSLLDRYKWAPQRHAGLLPLVELVSSTYKSPMFGVRPKPLFKIAGWVKPDGSSPTPPAGRLPPKGGDGSAGFNDELPADLS